MPFAQIAVVACGGAVGAAIRAVVVHTLTTNGMTGTIALLTINTIGSLLAGIVVAVGLSVTMSIGWHVFLLYGVLGGFTTFSAFAIDTVSLWHDERWWMVSGITVAHVLLAVLAAAVGLLLGKRLFG